MLREAGGLVSLNIFAQAIPLVGTPFLSRLYSAADFGSMGFFTAAFLVLGAVSTLRFDQYLYTCAKPQALKLVGTGLFISGVVPPVLVALIIFGAAYHDLELDYLKLLLATSIFAFSQILIAACSISEKFSAIGVSLLIKSAATVLFQLIYPYLFGLSSQGLILGILFGLAVQLAYLVLKAPVHLTRPRPISEIKDIVARDGGFFLAGSIQSLLNAFSTNLPVFLIGAAYGEVSLGYYTMAMRFLALPATFFGNAIRPYVLKLISNNVHEGETAGLTMLQFCTWVSIVSVILLSATLLLISETVFSYVLGDAWGDVGIYVTILAPWMVTAFFNIPGVSFFTVMKFSRLLLLYDISLFLLRILVFFVASYFLLDIAEFLLIFSMVGFVFNYWLIVYSYACARRVGEKALLRC